MTTVADPVREAWRRRGVVMLAASAGEAALGIALASGAANASLLLGAHAAIVVLIARGLGTPWRGAPPSRLVALFVVCTAALGPLGAFGSLFAALLFAYFAPRATPFERWYAQLVPDAPSTPVQALFRRLTVHGEGSASASGVVSFTDVMAGDNPVHKQAAIALIASSYRPGFAAALRQALNDDDSTVRVQAATATARLEGRFLRESIALEARRTRRPGDPGLTHALAQLYDRHANSGLLDAGRASEAREHALELYRECERLSPGDPAIARRIVRLIVRLGRDAEAVERYAPHFAVGAVSPRLAAWYVESLFRLRRFDALRKACWRIETADGLGTAEGPSAQAVSLWAAHGACR